MSAALPTALELLSWVATYALHSTLLLAGACLLVRLLPRNARRARELAWRAALLGPLATASLQVGLDLAPLGRRLDLTPFVAQRAVEAPERPAPTRVSDADAAALARARLGQGATPARLAAKAKAGRLGAERLAILAWGGGALIALLGLARSLLSLRTHLGDRRELDEGPLRGLLEELCRRTGSRRTPRLTLSARLSSPLSLGVLRPEICVPARATTDLTRAQQEALLAHELGHLARRDPLWQLVQHALCGALFFQPLNRLARRRLEGLAELAADDFAVRATGRPAPLARCLAQVATWIVGARRHPAPAMAATSSHLGRRVERLLERGASPAPERRGPAAPALAAGVLLGFSLCAPGAAASPTVAMPDAELRGTVDFTATRSGASVGTPAGETGASAVSGQAAVLLEALDAEIDALVSEVQSLAREIEEAGLTAEYEADLAWIEGRANELREGRARLRALLESIAHSGALTERDARPHRTSPAEPDPATNAVFGRED